MKLIECLKKCKDGELVIVRKGETNVSSMLAPITDSSYSHENVIKNEWGITKIYNPIKLGAEMDYSAPCHYFYIE